MNVRDIVYWIKTYNKKPLVIVCGSTASGKSSCAIDIAKQLQGQGKKAEIISADSRQIYADIPIFSGAVTQAEMGNITHHLVGTEDPAVTRSADWFRHTSFELINQIHNRGAIPIVAGGSAFWVQSLLFKDDYPKVETNQKLRNELEKLSVSQLQHRLQQLDPKRFETIDIDNPRRLVRSIEIATELGSVPRMSFTPQSNCKTTIVYFDLDKQVLDKKIRTNVIKRFDAGLIAEAAKITKKITKERFIELGLAYKYMHDYWGGDMTEAQLHDKTTTEEIRYAKRQKTFFKKIMQRTPARKYVVDTKDVQHAIVRQVVSQLI